MKISNVKRTIIITAAALFIVSSAAFAYIKLNFGKHAEKKDSTIETANNSTSSEANNSQNQTNEEVNQQPNESNNGSVQTNTNNDSTNTTDNNKPTAPTSSTSTNPKPAPTPTPTPEPTPAPAKPSGFDAQLTSAYKTKYENSPYKGEKSSFFIQKAKDIVSGKISKDEAITTIKAIKPWQENIPDIGDSTVYITNARVTIQETTATDITTIFREAYNSKLIMSTDFTDTEIYWDASKKKNIVVRLGVTFEYQIK